MGDSIPYNPVFFSYAMITPEAASLYIDESKLTAEARSHLGSKVEIRPYGAIFEDSQMLSKSGGRKASNGDKDSNSPTKKFLISTKASWALSLNLGGEEKVEEVRSPIGDAKAIKNETEMMGMRSCHIRDGAALSEYFAWLEEQLVEKGATLDEVEAADKLEQIRSYVITADFTGIKGQLIGTGEESILLGYPSTLYPQPARMLP